MGQNNDSGDKTEQPTHKKLQDARKKGDVSKSTEVTSTVVLILWFALFGLVLMHAIEQITELATTIFDGVDGDFAETVSTFGWAALETMLVVSALFMIPVAIFGTLVEFLQTGPVLSFEKIKPKMENLNPAEGVKRMFGMDSLIEGLKALAKTVLLFLIGWWALKAAIPEISLLLYATPSDIGNAMWVVIFKLLGWTIGIFALLSLLDAAYQRFSFLKKMRMSVRDIQQELKDTEGDPHIKGQRKQAHQEWTQQGAVQASQEATALVVNPTHVAIAINYNRDECPVPTVTAKGEDHVARAMREAAEKNHIPIVRNRELARELLVRSETGELVPRDLFDIIAEVILWAQQVRKKINRENGESDEPEASKDDPSAIRQYAPPGEDLTVYPEDFR